MSERDRPNFAADHHREHESCQLPDDRRKPGLLIDWTAIRRARRSEPQCRGVFPPYFWHVNSAEGYFSILKRTIFGCYFHVSEAHLHRYTAERDFVYNHRERLGFDDLARSDAALVGTKGKRLTYRKPRGSGTATAPTLS